MEPKSVGQPLLNALKPWTNMQHQQSLAWGWYRITLHTPLHTACHTVAHSCAFGGRHMLHASSAKDRWLVSRAAHPRLALRAQHDASHMGSHRATWPLSHPKP